LVSDLGVLGVVLSDLVSVFDSFDSELVELALELFDEP
jgi:hypothetical protein